MKAVIGEYGKIIIFTIALSILAAFFFERGEDGFLGLLAFAKPAEQVGNADAFGIVREIVTRKEPELSVCPKKLKKGGTYNLLDITEYEIRAVNEEGERTEISVTKIIDPKEKDITAEILPEQFVPVLPGMYQVTYQTAEQFLGSTQTTEKIYRFVTD